MGPAWRQNEPSETLQLLWSVSGLSRGGAVGRDVGRAGVFPAQGSCHVHLFVGTPLVAQGLPEARPLLWQHGLRCFFSWILGHLP